MKIFQLEVTNDCNAACPFCIRSKMTRPIGYMPVWTYRRCLDLILQEPPGPSRTVNLHNLGESLLHPQLLGYVWMATERGIVTALSTNGSCLDQELVYDLEDAGLALLRISVDAVGAEYCYETRGDMVLKAHAVLPDSSAPEEVYRKGLDDQGGLIAGAPHRPKCRCSFLYDSWRVVLWDGTVVTCCLDYDAENPLGTVWDEEWKEPGISLCETCSGYVMQTALVAGNYETGVSDVDSVLAD